MYDESATIFTTVTVDAGRHIIPLCISHLPSSEDASSWRKHYATVKKHFPDFDRASTVDIADGDKGISAALGAEAPSIGRFRCYRHRYENLWHKGKAMAKSYQKLVYTFSDAKFRTIWNNMSPEHQGKISLVPHENQFMLRAYEKGIFTRGWSTNSMVECYNKVLKNVRHMKSPMEVAMAVFKLVEETLDSRVNEVQSYTQEIPPIVRQRLQSGSEKTKDVIDYTVEVTSNGSEERISQRVVAKVFKSGYGRYARIVHLKAPGYGNSVTCTCERYKVVEGPYCVHIAAAASSTRFDLVPFVPRRDTTMKWKEQYAAYAQFVDGKTWPDFSYLEHEEEQQEEIIMDPRATPKLRGRPKKGTRRRSLKENIEDGYAKKKRATVTCSNCNERGHTKRTCTYQNQQNSNQ